MHVYIFFKRFTLIAHYLCKCTLQYTLRTITVVLISSLVNESHGYNTQFLINLVTVSYTNNKITAVGVLKLQILHILSLKAEFCKDDIKSYYLKETKELYIISYVAVFTDTQQKSFNANYLKKSRTKYLSIYLSIISVCRESMCYNSSLEAFFCFSVLEPCTSSISHS